MAYDQRSQYQPPSRPYYSRQPARAPEPQFRPNAEQYDSYGQAAYGYDEDEHEGYSQEQYGHPQAVSTGERHQQYSQQGYAQSDGYYDDSIDRNQEYQGRPNPKGNYQQSYEDKAINGQRGRFQEGVANDTRQWLVQTHHKPYAPPLNTNQSYNSMASSGHNGNHINASPGGAHQGTPEARFDGQAPRSEPYRNYDNRGGNGEGGAYNGHVPNGSGQRLLHKQPQEQASAFRSNQSYNHGDSQGQGRGFNDRRPAGYGQQPLNTQLSGPPPSSEVVHGYSNGAGNERVRERNGHLPVRPTQSPIDMQAVSGVPPTKAKSTPRERMRPPTSPQTTSWDNPFPTFPNPKKKTTQPKLEDVSETMTGMSLENGAGTTKGHSDQRPSTARSKSSEEPTRVQGEALTQNYSRSNNSGQSRVERPDYSRDPPSTESRRTQPGRGAGQGNSPSTHGRSPIRQTEVAPNFPLKDGRFTETRTAPPSPSKQVFGPGTQRSRTMPTGMTEEMANNERHLGYSGQQAWQDPGPMIGYHGPEGRDFIPPRPATSSGSRPTPTYNSRLNEVAAHHNNPFAVAPSHDAQVSPHAKQESLGDLFDSYYDSPNQNHGAHRDNLVNDGYMEDEMPNFDAVPVVDSSHRQGMTIDQHLTPRPPATAPSMPSYLDRGYSNESNYRQASNVTPSFPRSRSQPDLRGQNQAAGEGTNQGGFGISRDASGRPPMPGRPSDESRQQYTRDGYGAPVVQPRQYVNQPGIQGAGQPNQGFGGRGGYPQAQAFPPRSGQIQRAGPHIPTRNASAETHRFNPGQRGIPQRGTPSPANQGGTGSSPVGRPNNPDALPQHPTPVRPGLIPGSVASQAIQTPPARQYQTGASPVQQMGPTQQPSIARVSQEKRKSLPVTHEELESLKQAAKVNPSDYKTQLLLAKKLVEAAAVLSGEGGRADAKTRNKNRERYIFDAHKLVKKLVGNGFPDAMFYLADCHGRGFLGLEADPKEAFTLYQSAAKAGHAQAAYRTAVCCELGQDEGGGTRKDPLKAIQWYKRAATLGDTPAMYKMGMILLKGLLGQPKNPREAVVWLKRAADRADQENPHALHELGLLYETASGNDSIIRDEAYSKQLFTQAANLGYKFSQFRLGCAYEYGSMGCPIDPRQSIACYSRAAVQEEHQSELALSGWYLTGSEGVLQQSDTEAYLWARKAAQAGLAKAEYAMGYFTEVGIGAPANIDDAKRWYWRAAAQNFPKARERLEALRKGGNGAQKSRERISRSKVHKSNEGDCVVM
ncbi:MAG: hypothetical protein M1827_001075 [Pycnora praestabilis]|nr:MAG: hypothetical protein M1827_001075 [Pycnora praestabilis]